MTMFSWKLVHGGKTPPAGEVVRPDERLGWGQMAGLGRSTWSRCSARPSCSP